MRDHEAHAEQRGERTPFFASLPPTMNRLRKEPFLAFVALLGVTIVSMTAVFAKGILSNTGAVPGTYPDVNHFVWNAWYLSRSLHGTFSYTTALLFWPNGTSLQLHTLTEGVLLPLATIFPDFTPQQLYTVACALSLALTWIILSLVFSAVSRSRGIGFLLGTACIAHPFWYSHLDGGHLNMLAFFPVPLCILLGMSIESSRRIAMGARIVCGGGCLAFLGFTNLYYLYFLALLLACGAAASAWYRQRKMLTYCIGAPLVGIILAAPRLVAVARVALAHTFSANHDPTGNSINIAHLFLPSSYQLLSAITGWFSPNYQGAPNPTETAAYLGVSGVVALFLAVCSARRRERAGFLAGFALFLILACGPALHLWNLTPTWNPVYAIFGHLPLFPSVPARFFILALFMLLIALAHVARSHPRGVALLAIASVCEWVPQPITWQTLATTPVLNTIRNSSIIALHDATPSLELRSLHQVFHEKPITAGFLARVPRKEMRNLRRNAFIAFLEGRRSPPSAEKLRADFDILAIDALLVPVSAGEVQDRIATCNWLHESARDDSFVLFELLQTESIGEARVNSQRLS